MKEWPGDKGDREGSADLEKLVKGETSCRLQAGDIISPQQWRFLDLASERTRQGCDTQLAVTSSRSLNSGDSKLFL